MARRISIQSLIAVLLFVANSAGAGVIAHYNFDDEDFATGPDTFAVFENAKGRVDLANDVRLSGYRSLAITDVADDGDFPELQGYYPVLSKGMVRFRFAMLIATPNEQLNVALAGPGHFTMSKDGIAFWLKSDKGWLHHMSDSMPKKLFPVQSFVWYVVDVRYAIDRGTYDLTITQEGVSAPLVDLKNQPNATSSAQSAVSMFSFVGEVFGDSSNVRYYVDDILLTTDMHGDASKFVAPGRQQLFIDRWREWTQAAATKKSCLPLIDLDDVGGSANDIGEARKRIAWLREACARIEAGDEKVVRELDERFAANRRAIGYALASMIAVTRRDRWEDAERRWVELGPLLRNDVRYGVIAALLGMHRKNWDDAELWLQSRADDNVEDDLRRKLIAEEYYFVLLWKKDYATAARYAERVAQRLARMKIDAAWWRERAGDAELLASNYDAARKFYESALTEANRWSVTEKLADIAYLQKDYEAERKLREQLYGTLR